MDIDKVSFRNEFIVPYVFQESRPLSLRCIMHLSN
jgi:hypothetical protein